MNLDLHIHNTEHIGQECHRSALRLFRISRNTRLLRLCHNSFSCRFCRSFRLLLRLFCFFFYRLYRYRFARLFFYFPILSLLRLMCRFFFLRSSFLLHFFFRLTLRFFCLFFFLSEYFLHQIFIGEFLAGLDHGLTASDSEKALGTFIDNGVFDVVTARFELDRRFCDGVTDCFCRYTNRIHNPYPPYFFACFSLYCCTICAFDARLPGFAFVVFL